MVFPERSRTMTHTTRETVNRLARKQLYLNHVVPERPRRRNLYIEQEKHKLDQIVARNIRMFLDKPQRNLSPQKQTHGDSNAYLAIEMKLNNA